MEGVTFPQPAGDIFIRPASPARSTSSSSQLQDEGTYRDRKKDSSGLPSPKPLSRGLSQRQNRHHFRTGSMSSSTSTPPPSSSGKKRQQLQVITDLKRGAPADPSFSQIAQRSPDEARAARQKSQYYGEMFASRDPADSFRERAARESVITAEIKTNVIIRDEYSFLTALSSFLAQRYTRSESSIAITLQHSTCVLLAASFDPAYLMTISAVPEMVGPTLNKRNAALIQRHMQDELAVPSDRGIVRFVPVPDSCLATCGTTLLAETEAAAANGGATIATKKSSSSHMISLTSPWKTSFGRQQERRQQQYDGSSTVSNAKHSGTGAGGSVAESAAAGAAGAVGAMVGAAGNLFGRRKESKRDLKEQEKRSLLKGKAREGSRTAATTTLMEEGEHIEEDDGDDREAARGAATVSAPPAKTSEPGLPAPEEKGSWFSRAKNSTRQRAAAATTAAATTNTTLSITKKPSNVGEASDTNKYRETNDGIELQASRLTAKQNRSRASLSSAFRRSSVDSETRTGGRGTPTLRHKSKLIGRHGPGLAQQDEPHQRPVHRHEEQQHIRQRHNKRPDVDSAPRVYEVGSSCDEAGLQDGGDGSVRRGISKRTGKGKGREYYYVDDNNSNRVRDSRTLHRDESGKSYHRDDESDYIDDRYHKDPERVYHQQQQQQQYARRSKFRNDHEPGDRNTDENSPGVDHTTDDGNGYRYEDEHVNHEQMTAMAGESDRYGAAEAVVDKGKNKAREREPMINDDGDDVFDSDGANVRVAATEEEEGRAERRGARGEGQETVGRRRSLMGVFRQ